MKPVPYPHMEVTVETLLQLKQVNPTPATKFNKKADYFFTDKVFVTNFRAN